LAGSSVDALHHGQARDEESLRRGLRVRLGGGVPRLLPHDRKTALFEEELAALRAERQKAAGAA